MTPPIPAPSMDRTDFKPPASILIIGAGVFGLSTALALTQRQIFAKTSISIIDRSSSAFPATEEAEAAARRRSRRPDDEDVSSLLCPARDAASVDSSRIVRPCYADAAYTALAKAAQEVWRRTGPGELGEETYFESGMFLTASAAAEAEAEAEAEADSDGNRDGDDGKLFGSSAGRGVEGEISAGGGGGGGGGAKTPMQYVKESYENVVRASSEESDGTGSGRSVVPFRSPRELRETTGAAGHVGDWGYLHKESGWADAERGMRWLSRKVRETGRVTFVTATVEKLLWAGDTVLGAKLTGNEELHADLCILAAGAWTGRLADMRNICSATGQALGYIQVTAEEQAMMKDMPIILNLSNGLFILPPRNGILKVARHARGYFNPVKIPSSIVLPSEPPSGPSPSQRERQGTAAAATLTVSLPHTTADDPSLELPLEARRALRQCLASFMPATLASTTSDDDLASRPFARTRLCWYNDTADGHFLVDRHPRWKGLFVATGGSGHAYKFLPVLGERVVDVLLGDPAVEGLRRRWAWREAQTLRVGDDGFRAVVTEDGSRSGKRGMVLREYLSSGLAKL